MDKLEMNVRECARTSHDCDAHVKMLSMNNTPTDPEKARTASEELQVARAKAMRAYYALLSAKSDYAK